MENDQIQPRLYGRTYGLQRMEQETGMLTDKGYISYHSMISLEELTMEEPAEAYRQGQGFQMRGMA